MEASIAAVTAANSLCITFSQGPENNELVLQAEKSAVSQRMSTCNDHENSQFNEQKKRTERRKQHR